MDIYSIGEMVIDFIPGEKEGEYIRNAGGAPANVAIAAARNGLEAGMCCKVGDDDFGRFLVDTLKKEHVKVISDNLCEEAITTMAFVCAVYCHASVRFEIRLYAHYGRCHRAV